MNRGAGHLQGGRSAAGRLRAALVDAGTNVERGRPLEGDGVLLRLAPWVAAGVLAFALLPLLPDGITEPANLIAGALVPIILVIALIAPWERLPTWTQALPAMVPFLMVALIRSSHESTESAYTPVVLLPVFWFALYGTRPQLLVSVAAVGVTLAIPSPAVDGDNYPITEVGAALLWMVIAGITGLTISELVRQRETLQARLGRMAHTDQLTGLPNRRAWDDEFERELARADRSGSPMCVVLMDLDHFKEFNDLHGHLAGDDHLRRVAKLWRERLRGTDLIARYGGEEFALVLTATTVPRGREVVDGLRESVPGGETVSAGIAQWDGSESGAELIARADRALYEAKRSGRDRTVALPMDGAPAPAG
jgi:diguanylate cyclase (GGDEF)-like protein